MIKWLVIYSLILWVSWPMRWHHGWCQAEKFGKFDLFRSFEIAMSGSFKHFFKLVLLHQTGDCESGSMVKCPQKTFQFLLPLRWSSLQQELKFLCLQCSWNLVWNKWIGHMLKVITTQCSVERKTQNLVWSFKLKTAF